MHAEKDGGLIKFQPRKYLLVPVLPVSGLHTLHPLYFCGIKKRHIIYTAALRAVTSPPRDHLVTKQSLLAT